MKREVSIPKSNRVDNLSESLLAAAKWPLLWLQKYYGDVLERRLSLRQTWLLINAQAAFLFAVFPVECPLLLRFAFLGWLLDAVLRCKREIK